MPQKPLYYFSNLPQIVTYNPEMGKFTLNMDYSPAYSGRNWARVERHRAMRQAVDAIRFERHVNEMIGARYIDDPYDRYKTPNTGDEEWDTARAEADYLNFQIQGQGSRAEGLGDGEPGGWRGVLHDALDNPVGGAVTRGLDILGRPAYAVAELTQALAQQQSGESYEHPDWVPLEESNVEYRRDGQGGWEPVPGQRRGPGWWKNTKTGEVERHTDWAKPDENPWHAMLQGAREGITGRKKTSWSDVLRQQDTLEGKPAAALGFVGDMVFDPTNYVSFGTSTAARKTTALGALNAADRAVLDASARTLADDLLRTGAVRGPLAEARAGRRAMREVMEAEGITRRPVRDVIEDINSSYGEHSVERAMRDRVSEALKDPFWSRTNQRKIARTARDVAKAEAAARGATLTAKEIKTAGTDALKQARDEFQKKVGADVMDEIAARQALRQNINLDVKIGGRRVISSRTGGRVIEAGSRALRGSGPGQFLAKTFRTDAQVGEALHRIKRQFANASSSQFEAEAKEIKRFFTDLGISKKERSMISRALENGDTKGFTPKMVEGFDKAQEMFRAAFDREVDAGALSPSDWKDNYLYHVYRNRDFSRGLGSWVKPTGGGAKKFRTLSEAEARGARPMTDIADILTFRLAKSHRVASTHLMMREIAARFGIDLAGSKVPQKTLRGLKDSGVLVEARRLSGGVGRFFDSGVYFDQDVAASLVKMEQIFRNEETITRLGRLFDNVQARMKFLQTAPNPGFHVRNTISDMFVNYLDGVTSPQPYWKAIRLIRGEGDLTRVVVKLRNGSKLTGEDVLRLYEGMGLKAGFFHAEAGIIPGMHSKWLTGGSNLVRGISETREDIMRMAHFVDALKKGKRTKTVEEAAEIAAKRVRKYNFDYQDLTLIERKVFRRAVPFYTFMRKNVPLMLESYLTRPGRMIAPTKGMNAMADFLGQDNRDEPLPGLLNATPEWMRVMPGIEAVANSPTNDPVFIQPDMPYNQLESLFGGFAAEGSVGDKLQSGGRQFLKEILLEQSSPLFRIPAEWATQTDLATGADQPQTPLDAIINNFPVGRLVQRPLSNAAPGLFAQSDRPDAPTYTVHVAGKTVHVSETVANYVTGLGFRKVTPERMQSELRRRQDIIEAIIRRLEEGAVKEAQEEWDEEYGSLYGD